MAYNLDCNSATFKGSMFVLQNKLKGLEKKPVLIMTYNPDCNSATFKGTVFILLNKLKGLVRKSVLNI